MKKNEIIFSITIFVIITTIWLSSWKLLQSCISTQEERGQFGDMFGAINSLFSGLALFGVILSIYLQNNEIKNSKYEFRFNRLMGIITNHINIVNNFIDKSDFNTNTQKDNFDVEFLKLDALVNLYSVYIKKEKHRLDTFNEKNASNIAKLITYIADEIRYIKHLIEIEKIDIEDANILKKYFSRNINRNIIEFIEIATEYIKYEKSELAPLKGLEYDGYKLILKINTENITEIAKFLDYRVK
jgi:hypothetical protein